MFDDIRQAIIDDPSNAWAKAKNYQPVYSASASARIVIIGQAPGRKAQESGIPWNDVSGDTLREWLGLNKEQFYDEKLVALIPMDFYFPGKGPHGDLPPRKDFAARWHPQLLAHMPDVALTILVGQYAQKYYLDKNRHRNLTETVKNYETYLPEHLPLVHPSPLTIRWRAKNPWFEQDVLPHVRQLVQTILS